MNKRLFVAGLPYSTTDEELKILFSSFGNCISAVVIKDRETNKSKGFGFVEMETQEEALSAIDKLNNSEYQSRKIIVNEAKPREDRGFKPRNRSFGRDNQNNKGPRRTFGMGSGRRSNFKSFDRKSSFSRKKW